MEAARELGATRADLISYSNSGETTLDYTSVVAYASLSIA
jgi:AmmeMemoRadiSam system protein B